VPSAVSGITVIASQPLISGILPRDQAAGCFAPGKAPGDAGGICNTKH
jgi:hypothetical protein